MVNYTADSTGDTMSAGYKIVGTDETQYRFFLQFENVGGGLPSDRVIVGQGKIRLRLDGISGASVVYVFRYDHDVLGMTLDGNKTEFAKCSQFILQRSTSDMSANAWNTFYVNDFYALTGDCDYRFAQKVDGSYTENRFIAYQGDKGTSYRSYFVISYIELESPTSFSVPTGELPTSFNVPTAGVNESTTYVNNTVDGEIKAEWVTGGGGDVPIDSGG